MLAQNYFCAGKNLLASSNLFLEISVNICKLRYTYRFCLIYSKLYIELVRGEVGVGGGGGGGGGGVVMSRVLSAII